MGDHKHKTKGVLLSDIEKKIDRIRINEFGFVGVSTRVFPLTENAASAKVSGSISPYVWSMELGINNKWTPEKDTYIKEFLQERSAAEKGIMVVGGDTGRHEFGHPGFCPKSLDSYTRILDATTVELDSMGIKSKSTAKYLANCFMDLIDNANVRGMGQGDGLTIFYYIQGDSGFYSSFIALNMLAWGQEADRKLIGRKFEQNFSDKELAAVQKPANEYAAQIGLGKLDNTGNFAEKSDAEKLDTLNNDSGWEEYARLFARKFGNMVKHKEPQKDDGKDQSGNDSKQDGEKGESESGEKDNDKKKEKDPDGKGKKENEKGEKKDGEKEGGEEKDSDVDDGPEEPGKHMGKKAEKSKNKASGKSETDETDEPDSGPGENPFDREISTPEGMKKAIEGAVKSGRGLPKFMNSDEAIDLYYELISKPIPVKSNPQSIGASFPAVPFGGKEFDPEHDDAEMISGVMLNDFGKMTLKAYTDVHEVNAPFLEKLVAHPDFCLIVDGSGSMKMGGGNIIAPAGSKSPQWGDQTKYHYALKAAHGIRNYLKSENILPYIRTNMMTFSNATQATGWKDYSQGAVGRAELVRPEFSGTVLNLKVLEKELLNRPSAVVVLISDGAIDNWATDGKKIMEIFKNHSVAFVQIGGENQTGRDMKAAGFTVLSVNSERDLEGMLIDVSGQLYRNSGESQSLSSDMILPK